MSTTKRRIKIKFTNEIGQYFLDLLGNPEVTIEIEESNKIYKNLSSSEFIEDWDFCSGETIEEKPKTTTKTIPEIIKNIELYRRAAQDDKIYKSGMYSQECEEFIRTNQDILDSIPKFDFMGIKTFFEFKYKGDEETMNSEVTEILNNPGSWEKLKSSKTILSAVSSLFK